MVNRLVTHFGDIMISEAEIAAAGLRADKRTKFGSKLVPAPQADMLFALLERAMEDAWLGGAETI